MLGAISVSGSRPRVAVIGGGTAGVAAAWLLDGACDVVLFEKDARLGGHAHSIDVELGGSVHTIDVGAQFVGRRLHSNFVSLLEEIGIIDPAAPTPEVISREMGTTIGDACSAYPRFVSPMFREGRLWPLVAPWNLAGQAAFLILTVAAARLDAAGDWSITLDEWLRGVPGLGEEQRERVLLPWLAALAGCSLETARGFSALAAVAVPARSRPGRPLDPFEYITVVRGLGHVIEELARSCSTLRTHMGAQVTRIERVGPCWNVITKSGAPVEVDNVLFASPPYAVREVLRGVPGLERASAVLGGFSYFPTRVAIHTDPIYMHTDRRMWSAYNATTTSTHCEGSIWYGAIRDRLPNGATLDIFKSWVSARDRRPKGLLHERTFQHPVISPGFVAAQRRLAETQGESGIHFAGSYTRDVDLQETALLSAIAVAESIAPAAKNLGRLRARRARVWMEQRRAAQANGSALARLSRAATDGLLLLGARS